MGWSTPSGVHNCRQFWDRALAPEVMFPSPQRLWPVHLRIVIAPLKRCSTLFSQCETALVVSLRQAVTKQADGTLLGRNPAFVAKLIRFPAPEECLADKAGGPHAESQQIGQRIQPPPAQRPRQASCRPPSQPRERQTASRSTFPGPGAATRDREQECPCKGTSPSPPSDPAGAVSRCARRDR